MKKISLYMLIVLVVAGVLSGCYIGPYPYYYRDRDGYYDRDGYDHDRYPDRDGDSHNRRYDERR